MDIPAFSLFSALSELVVTAIVLYTIVGNLRGKPFRWGMLGLCLVFELCVNVIYMVFRAGTHDTTQVLTPTLSILYPVHGILSLVMFVGLAMLYLIATFDHKAGHPTWFQRHTAGTWSFVVFWIISVGTGEVIFVWRYLV